MRYLADPCPENNRKDAKGAKVFVRLLCVLRVFAIDFTRYGVSSCVRIFQEDNVFQTPLFIRI